MRHSKNLGDVAVRVELPDVLDGIPIRVQLHISPVDAAALDRVIQTLGGLSAFSKANPDYNWLTTLGGDSISAWVDVPNDASGKSATPAPKYPGVAALRGLQEQAERSRQAQAEQEGEGA